MDNKEIRNTAMELNDEALENVSGGLVKPIIWDGQVKMIGVRCAKCQIMTRIAESVYQSKLINGTYYCDNCKNAMT